MNKPVAVFVGEYEPKCRVYGENTIKKLEEKLDFIPHFYTEKELKDGTEHAELSKVEYVFSTWGMAKLTEAEIAALFPSLKAVFYAAGTVQYFARPFLERGVRVFSAWMANAVPVAEYTVAQIILANKGFFKSSVPCSRGNRAEASEKFSHYPGNYGAKIGIIGAGAIGKLVIQRLKTYSLEVFVFDPFLPDETAQMLGVKKVSLETLFSECDVVSNHLANNAQTKGMLDGRLFRSMRPYATFLNTGRGAQVVENDLIATLESRPDLTAILDVTDPEPPEETSGFFRLDNCILTPHTAGSSGEEVKRMAEYMYEEFCRIENTETPLYEVTKKMLETMA